MRFSSLTFTQQCVRVSVMQQFQHLVLSDFSIILATGGFIMLYYGLIYISLLTSEVEHLSIYILSNLVSFMNCLAKS